jgi:hypothetical protein
LANEIEAGKILQEGCRPETFCGTSGPYHLALSRSHITLIVFLAVATMTLAHGEHQSCSHPYLPVSLSNDIENSLSSQNLRRQISQDHLDFDRECNHQSIGFRAELLTTAALNPEDPIQRVRATKLIYASKTRTRTTIQVEPMRKRECH